MIKRNWKNIEWSILICVVLLLAIGLFSLYSASTGQNAETNLDAFKKQLLWIAISLPIFIALIMLDYEILARFAPYLYGATLLLLVLVLFTTPIDGAKRWFQVGSFTMQPGEFGKIATVLFLSSVFVYFQKRRKTGYQ